MGIRQGVFYLHMADICVQITEWDFNPLSCSELPFFIDSVSPSHLSSAWPLSLGWLEGKFGFHTGVGLADQTK